MKSTILPAAEIAEIKAAAALQKTPSECGICAQNAAMSRGFLIATPDPWEVPTGCMWFSQEWDAQVSGVPRDGFLTS